MPKRVFPAKDVAFFGMNNIWLCSLYQACCGYEINHPYP